MSDETMDGKGVDPSAGSEKTGSAGRTDNMLARRSELESEVRWRDLVESLADIILQVNREGVIEYLNRVPGDIDPRDVIGRSIFDFMPPRQRGRARRALNSAVKNQRWEKYEAQGIAPDGSVNWYEMSLAPITRRDGSGGAIMAARNIDARKRTETEMRAARKALEAKSARQTEALNQVNLRLRELSRHLERERESERMTLASDLHDELGSTLTALKMKFNLLMDQAPCRKRDHIQIRNEINSSLDKAIDGIRSIIQRLRPPVLDDLGLADALRWQAGEMAAAAGLEIQVAVEPKDFAIEPEAATVLFRIYQELLTNIARHARAARVRTRLRRRARDIILEVVDDGRGMPDEAATPGHALGILGIKERLHGLGGSFRHTNHAGGGTEIFIRVPMPPRLKETAS